MKEKKRIIVTLIGVFVILMIILGVFVFLCGNGKYKDILMNGENSQINIGNSGSVKKNEVVVNSIDMKKDDLYEIEKEYDGREIRQVKPNVQFSVVLAGILKNGEPQEEEISELLKKSPNRCGIWISSQSRDGFIRILEENNLNQFEIDKDGYLVINGVSDDERFLKLKSAINSDMLYIIDVSGCCYILDNIDEKIIEYPFEQMDLYQTLECYSDDNLKVLVVTTNSAGKLTSDEILEDILLNF